MNRRSFLTAALSLVPVALSGCLSAPSTVPPVGAPARDPGEVVFTVHNRSDEPLTATLTIEGGNDSDTVQYRFPLDVTPETVRAVRSPSLPAGDYFLTVEAGMLVDHLSWSTAECDEFGVRVTFSTEGVRMERGCGIVG